MPDSNNKILNWTFADLPRDINHMIDNFKEFAEFLASFPEEKRNWKSGSELQKLFGKELRKEIFREKQREQIKSTLDRVARGALAKCKFLGLFYVDNNIAHITEAGRELLSTNRPQDIILKQLIKWQYPDPLRGHHGKNYSFNIFPFLITLKVLKKVQTLSKKEMALFLFTTVDYSKIEQTARNILMFRNAYNRAKGKIIKNKVFKDYQKRLFPKERYKKNPDSLKDYADAYLRALLFTELFICNDRGQLQFNSKRADEINEILKYYESQDIFDHTNTLIFYINYYGNPAYYILPNQERRILQKEIRELLAEIEGILSVNRNLQPRIYKRFDGLSSEREFRLEYRDKLEQFKSELNLVLLQNKFREPNKFRELLKYFDKIMGGAEDIYDPSVYLEWNAWRIFHVLDETEEIVPNFKMNSDLVPISCAGGNRTDIEVYYKTFTLGVEVTLTSGNTQWRREAYTVPRHIASLIDKSAKPNVYGLFIAPKIFPETARVYFDTKEKGIYGKKKFTIIPMNIALFKRVMSAYIENDFSPDKFGELLSSLEKNGTSERRWFDAIPEKVENWLKTF